VTLPYPFPKEGAISVANGDTVDLDPGQQATITFTPDQSGTVFRTPTVAISKFADYAYKIKMDDSTEWNESFPPTDIDDMGVVWIPAKEWRTDMIVEVSDLRSNGNTRTVHIQPLGWEEYE